jgi:hypothetical protein
MPTEDEHELTLGNRFIAAAGAAVVAATVVNPLDVIKVCGARLVGTITTALPVRPALIRPREDQQQRKQSL